MANDESRDQNPDRNPDQNPLDRISSGPAPTGPSPWRSNRLPTGSPYANGLYGTGDVGKRSRLGRAGWITLIVAVALIAGAVGWAAVSKPDAPRFASPIRTSAAPPPRPSVEQITGSALFTTALVTPPGCALPQLTTTREAVQALAAAGTVCLEAVWGLRPNRVEVFSAPDDVPPGTTCFSRSPVTSYGNCNDITFLNFEAAVEAAGNQAGALMQWLSRAVADHAESRAGVNADIKALVSSVGRSTPTGVEYRKRAHAQSLCLAGATLQRLVGRGFTREDMALASAESRIWTLIGDGDTGPKVDRGTVQSWFDRGSFSPTQDVCRTAWTVPVDQVS